jgi:hypothetical protein
MRRKVGDKVREEGTRGGLSTRPSARRLAFRTKCRGARERLKDDLLKAFISWIYHGHMYTVKKHSVNFIIYSAPISLFSFRYQVTI